MPKTGYEVTTIRQGMTVTGGFDVDRIVIGPNGVVAPNAYPNVFSPMVSPFPSGLSGAVAGATFNANDARGVRAVAPRDGVIVEFAVFVTVSNGNLDIGAYDYTTTTRARLGSTGTTAVGTVNTWQTVAPTTPISVFRGQIIDLAIATSSATATFLSAPALVNANEATMPANYGSVVYTDAAQATLGASTAKLAWVIATSFPLPTTLTDASLTQSVNSPIILARMG